MVKHLGCAPGPFAQVGSRLLMNNPVPAYLDASAVTSSGEPLELLWKAWRHADGTVWWDFVKVSDTLGLCSTSHDTRLSTWLRGKIPTLLHEWGVAGLSEREAFAPSFRAAKASMKRTRDEDVGDIILHEVPVVTTPALLVTLMFLGKGGAKKHELRNTSVEVASMWCQQLGSSNLLQTDWLALPTSVVAQCSARAIEEASCPHIHQWGVELAGEVVPQLRLFKFICGLAISSSMCQAARAWYQHCVAALARDMDMNLPARAYTSNPVLSRQPILGPRLRHNHDEDLKQHVARAAISDGKAKSSSQYVRSNETVTCHAKSAARWEDKCSLQYQAAGWNLGKHIKCLSIAMDAGRFGSPAESTEVFAAASCTEKADYFMWLPVQVPLDKKSKSKD